MLYPYTYAATVDVQSGSFLKSEFRIEKLQLFKKLVSLVCKYTFIIMFIVLFLHSEIYLEDVNTILETGPFQYNHL